MKRYPPIVLAVLLATSIVATAPRAAEAATSPGTYTGTAGGTIADANFNSQTTTAPSLGTVGFVASGVKVNSAGTPKVISGSATVAGKGLGQDLGFGINVRTAGPSSGSATSTSPAFAQQGVSVGAVTSTNQADYTSTTGCTAATVGESVTKSSGVTVAPATFGRAAAWGTSETSGRVSLGTISGSDNQSVVSESSGSIGDISIYGEDFKIHVEGKMTLTATATGQAGGASTSYVLPKITITSPRGDRAVLQPGAAARSETVRFRGKRAIFTFEANVPTASTPNDGSASIEVSLMTMTVKAAPGEVEGSGTLNLLHLKAAATAPEGGVVCPSGATTNPTTPSDPTTTELATEAPTTAPAAPVAPTTGPTNGQNNGTSPILASTGGPTGLLIVFGAMLIAAGAFLVPYSVRRRRHS